MEKENLSITDYQQIITFWQLINWEIGIGERILVLWDLTTLSHTALVLYIQLYSSIVKQSYYKCSSITGNKILAKIFNPILFFQIGQNCFVVFELRTILIVLYY